MKNIFKEFVDKVFGKEGTKEENSNRSSSEIVNRGPISPGLEETKEDVGKKVFEKTGRIREGVGQSSTVAPKESEEKVNQERVAKLEEEDTFKQEFKPAPRETEDIVNKGERINKVEAENKSNEGVKKPHKKPYRGRKHKEKKD